MPKYGFMSQAEVGKRPEWGLNACLVEILGADNSVSSISDCSKSILDD